MFFFKSLKVDIISFIIPTNISKNLDIEKQNPSINFTSKYDEDEHKSNEYVPTQGFGENSEPECSTPVYVDPNVEHQWWKIVLMYFSHNKESLCLVTSKGQF